MPIELTIHNPHAFEAIPQNEAFLQWITTTLPPDAQYECGIRLVDPEESAALNKQFRQKPTATNVLAFPWNESDPSEGHLPYLGDLALCTAIVQQEATAQNTPLMAHWAHLVVHGTLHLLGYDHQTAEEAAHMEQLEINTLARLGYPNPYET